MNIYKTTNLINGKIYVGKDKNHWFGYRKTAGGFIWKYKCD